MALMNGFRNIEGTRSHTKLIKSGHLSPAEEWILDPIFRNPGLSSVFKDGVLFQYLYGGPGQEEVVIPKGRVVGVNTPVKDFVSNKFKSTLTLPGLTKNQNSVGVVPYNITKDWFQLNRSGGNQPSIITQDYITVPYIPAVSSSSKYNIQGVIEEEQKLSIDLKNPWGALIGAGIQNGDYVKTTPSGRFCKFDKENDNVLDIVGQILNLDFNQEQWGWRKWMLWDEASKYKDDAYINRSGVSNLPSDNGYPFDPKYIEGDTIFQEYQSQYVTNPTGATGLHDGSGNHYGYGRNDTSYENMDVGDIPDGIQDDVLMTFQLKDFAGGKLTNIREISEICIDGAKVDFNRITVNYKVGTITISLKAIDANKKITATYKAYHFGTPTYLDFKGVAGAACILLMK